MTELSPGDESIIKRPTVGQLRRESAQELKRKTKELYESKRAERAEALKQKQTNVVRKAAMPSSMAFPRSRVQPLRSARNAWAFDAPTGLDPYECESYERWKNFSANFRPGDTIEVWAEDGAYWAKLLVLRADGHGAKVRVIDVFLIDQPESDKEVPVDGYIVEYAGPFHKWRFRRESDDAIIGKEFGSREIAMSELQSYLKALVR